MAALDPRQKAERIASLFRDRHQIDILPSELMPADLGEAYAIRAAFEAIETARGRGAVAGYKIGLTTPIMQRLCGVDEPCYGAIFATEVHHRRAELPVRNYCRLGRRSSCSRTSATIISGSAPQRWSRVMYGTPGRSSARR